MEPRKKCPKCDVESMELSAYSHALPGYLNQNVPQQAKGKVSVNQAIEIRVYRCSKCSYLELYQAP